MAPLLPESLGAAREDRLEGAAHRLAVERFREQADPAPLDEGSQLRVEHVAAHEHDTPLELRTHAFLPYTEALWWTPGVAHDNPPHRRYHAAIVLGAANRGALDATIASPEVTVTQDDQAANCLALHTYAVDNTYAVVRDGQKLF